MKNIRYFQFGILSVISSMLLSTPAFSATTATANVDVNVPSVVSISGTDGVTTSQSLILNQSNIAFDSSLAASGNVSITWKANTNSNNGLKVTIQRSALSGTGSTQLQNALNITGAPAPGGDQSAQILGSYAAGIALPAIPDAQPADFCSTTAAGSANFNVQLGLKAPSSAGRGTVSTVLTFVAAAL